MDTLRRCIFRPYRPNHGPSFHLVTWDTGRRDWRGQTVIGYQLDMRENGAAVVLFQGEDFAGSPGDADDSNATVRGLMGFLTLRPGDTDPEYFDRYTDVQRAFCEKHAERLACEVEARFPSE